MNMDDEFASILCEECAREHLSGKYPVLDEERFRKALSKGKGNFIDVSILYEMLTMMGN